VITALYTGGIVRPIGVPAIPDGAVALRGGQIVAVGAASALADLAGPQTRITRLAPEQTLIPGLIDSHQHLLSYARSRTRLSLWDTTRLDDLLERVRRQADGQPPGSWIVAVGHDQGRLAEGRHPSRAELDAVAPHHPLLIYRACSHVALANTRALDLAGVGAQTADPPGGRLERAADGTLTGLLLESAMRLVGDAIVAPPIDWTPAILAAAREYHRRGITSVGEAALGHIDGPRDLERVEAAYAAGLRLRMAVMSYGELAEQLIASRSGPRQTDAYLATTASTPDSPLAPRFGCVKLFIDGTLGGGTAFLTEGYRDEPGNCGWPVMPAEELEERVEQAHRVGLQVAVHAIGDAAVALVAEIYGRALLRHPRADHRHRIEHVEVVHPGLPERMAQLGVVAGVQSPFTYWESGDVTRLGPRLEPWGHAWGSLLRAGVVIANGSDNPVLPDFHPLQGIAAAVTRRTHSGLLLAPHQAITAEQALESYTAGAAYASFDEHRIGRLRPGMLADLTVLSADPCGIEPEAIHTIQVDQTIVGGELAFER
jgi:predicted amidohydrolase YtcJ